MKLDSNAGREGAPEAANRLAGATSPYLLQHVYNPVHWEPWDEAALQRAREEGKPIFLSIGYAACHWCHVMAHESFENEEIARVLNAHFVSIKVDREERPDLDEIYMTATQILTNSGGWPMSVFLTPDLKPFFAGTYFPPEDRWGRPGFRSLLLSLVEAWTNRRHEVLDQAERLAAAIELHSASEGETASVTRSSVEAAVARSFSGFDQANGGFGSAPKFPPSMRMELALQRWNDPDWARQLELIVTTTLDRMARGGLYDQVGGGFHRYSVDAEWLAPHFEKMLYDNALLARIYVLAWERTGRWYWKRVARETLDYVLREMTSPEGGFYSTTDADSEGEEGLFFLWTPEQVQQVLGDEAARFCRIYDIQPEGNFEGRSIPNLIARSLDEWSEELDLSPEALDERLALQRRKLWEAREQRIHPLLDDKILSGWNGLMIRAFVAAAGALKDDRYREAAEAAAGFVLDHMRVDGRLMRSYRAGEARYPAYLEDYMACSLSLLDLHELTGAERWRAAGLELLNLALELFWDEPGGSFFFTSREHSDLITRTRSFQDGATPSGNSLAALALIRADRLRPGALYNDRLVQLLTTAAAQIESMPAAFPNMLVAATELLESRPEGIQPEGVDAVVISVMTDRTAAAAGSRLFVAAHLQIEDPYHLQGPEPPHPHLTATRFTVDDGPGFRLLRYLSTPTRQAEVAGEWLPIYEGEALLGAELEVLDDASGHLEIPVGVQYQPCSHESCLQPVSGRARLRVRVGEGRPQHDELFARLLEEDQGPES